MEGRECSRDGINFSFHLFINQTNRDKDFRLNHIEFRNTRLYEPCHSTVRKNWTAAILWASIPCYNPPTATDEVCWVPWLWNICPAFLSIMSSGIGVIPEKGWESQATNQHIYQVSWYLSYKGFFIIQLWKIGALDNNHWEGWQWTFWRTSSIWYKCSWFVYFHDGI